MLLKLIYVAENIVDTSAKGGPGSQGAPRFEFSGNCENERAQPVLKPSSYLVVCTQELQGINSRLLVDADVWEVLLTKDAKRIQLSKFSNIYI
jgi:hypothetical protein